MDELPHVLESDDSSFVVKDICLQKGEGMVGSDNNALILPGVAFAAGSFLFMCGFFIVDINKHFSDTQAVVDRAHGVRFESLKMLTSCSGVAIAACGVGLLAFSFKHSVCLVVKLLKLHPPFQDG